MIKVDSLLEPEDIYAKDKSSIIKFETLSYFDLAQYDLYDDKDFEKYKQDIEKLVRISYEYRHLISFLKYVDGMNACAFLSNVSTDVQSHISIEHHHSPFTLYDIVSTVINKRRSNNESLEFYDVAYEVAYLHYLGLVGLVPVCTTVHELIHNMYLFVPTFIVRGNYKQFMNLYNQYIDPILLENLLDIEALSLDYLNDPTNPDHPLNKQMQIFNHYATYIAIGQGIQPIDLQENYKLISNRISDIKHRRQTQELILSSSSNSIPQPKETKE